MTPACGRCGTRAVARINGARQCLACGQESDEDGRGAADAVDVVRTENHARMETMRWAAKLLHLRYKTLLRWARTGELPATDWDPRQSRRGRRVRLADSEELVEKKKTVECAECTGMTVLQEFPKGKQRRFCPPPAKCKTRWHSRHRQQ